ncbi:DUF4399 domain-containing protein [Hydrogenophaga sp. 2FB]|uniref:DUF4399 domain-containing protein n=1 Tax=Hydrogenophaga sp. 2FB TaxID=2502187 RepID=UPI001485C2A4|nr:DUF4399 domain-containing protein [Hydrogenophaga sp. 2FB]
MHALKHLAYLLLATASTLSVAQSSPPSKLHPWQAPPPRANSEAYFTNLKDGDSIETPYVLKFGLSGGWGLAPIAIKGSERSGHHHLLVNRDLPLNFKEALPFNDQYIHFGKGQMETVLTLAPGTYTLRMLLADQNHLPHFVYSKPAKITVTKKNDTDPKTLSVKGIGLQVAQPVVKPPFRVQFHASSFNVAQRAQRLEGSGHFRLTVAPASGAPAVIDFFDGQTEVWLAPPAGNYSLKLELLDNMDTSKQLTAPTTTQVRVE